MSKVDYTQYRTISELNAMFDSEEVAKGLCDKISLHEQEISARPKSTLTAAEKRRLSKIQACKALIERDRSACNG